jgi:predicted ATP-dependent serine protease
MAYYCKDCSYRGVTSGQLGECPACGSYNIVKRSLELEEKSPPAKWRLVVLVLLWIWLIALILRKLIL